MEDWKVGQWVPEKDVKDSAESGFEMHIAELKEELRVTREKLGAAEEECKTLTSLNMENKAKADSLAERKAWLERNAVNHETYCSKLESDLDKSRQQLESANEEHKLFVSKMTNEKQAIIDEFTTVKTQMEAKIISFE